MIVYKLYKYIPTYKVFSFMLQSQSEFVFICLQHMYYVSTFYILTV